MWWHYYGLPRVTDGRRRTTRFCIISFCSPDRGCHLPPLPNTLDTRRRRRWRFARSWRTRCATARLSLSLRQSSPPRDRRPTPHRPAVAIPIFFATRSRRRRRHFSPTYAVRCTWFAHDAVTGFFFFCSPYSTILACVCVSLVLPHHVRNKRRRRPFGPRAVQHRRRPHLQVRGVTIFTYLFIINRLFAGWRSSTTSWWVVGARIIAISLLISPRAISVVVIVVKRKYVNLAYAVSIFWVVIICIIIGDTRFWKKKFLSTISELLPMYCIVGVGSCLLRRLWVHLNARRNVIKSLALLWRFSWAWSSFNPLVMFC